MKNFIFKYLPLLLLLSNLALTWRPEGPHSLIFLKTLLIEPDNLEPQFTCDVYVDDILVERFSNKAETPRLKLCAPWVGQPKPDYFEKETQIILKFMDLFKEILKKVMRILNQSEIGYHSMQIQTSCDVLPGGRLDRGIFGMMFNDENDYLMLDTKKPKVWTKGGAAEILKQELDKSGFLKTIRTFLKGECTQLLLAHVDYGKEIFKKTDTPKVHVTNKVRADGNRTLRCWAMNFFPEEITLTWQRDGEKKALVVNVVETMPAGDGTFQKWAAVVVPSGEEQRYTCHVKHEGLRKAITVKWAPPESLVPIIPIVTGLVLGAVLLGAVVTFLIWKRKTKE